MHAFRHFVAPTAALFIGVGVVGCSSNPEAEHVPPTARLLVQGDQQLAYTATDDGTVYVFDATDETLVYSGKVEKGQSISIDPDEDQVMLDSRVVLEKDIHAGNRHRIYFEPSDESSRVVEKRTTIREERTAGDRIERRDVDEDDTTIRREETKHIDTEPDGDITVKKETTVETE